MIASKQEDYYVGIDNEYHACARREINLQRFAYLTAAVC
jgi:hypothetical protein